MQNDIYSITKNSIQKTVLLLSLLTIISPTLAEERDRSKETLIWLENDSLRLGANLSLGGAITHVGPAGSSLNVVNNHDWGRQVQMSFYSGPVPYEPGGKKPKEHWAGLGWNPIQSGDCYNNRSQVLSHELRDGELHVICKPMHWPLDNVPGECTFESWIRLEGNTARVRARLNNARPDTTWFGAHGQELPAVYTNGVYYRLMTYTGDAPYTQGALERITQKTEPGFPWKFWNATEHWAALVNEEDWGLGIVMPASTRFCGGFSGKEGSGGTLDAPTGYIAPLGKEELDHNITYDFEYVLVLGKLEEIRRVAEAVTKPAGPPAWTFARDRQSWTYADARDTGWPIQGALDVQATGPAPRLLSPTVFWRAETAKQLEIVLANPGEERNLRVCWRRHGEEEFKEGNCLSLPLAKHEEMRTYQFDLYRAAEYSGGMLQLKLDFPGAQAPAPGPLLKVASVRLLP